MSSSMWLHRINRARFSLLFAKIKFALQRNPRIHVCVCRCQHKHSSYFVILVEFRFINNSSYSLDIFTTNFTSIFKRHFLQQICQLGHSCPHPQELELDAPSPGQDDGALAALPRRRLDQQPLGHLAATPRQGHHHGHDGGWTSRCRGLRWF